MRKPLIILFSLLSFAGIQAEPIKAHFKGGNGDEEVDQFPGRPGGGWKEAWFVGFNDGARGVEKVLNGADQGYSPFGKSGSYLSLRHNKGIAIRESAQRAILREYEDHDEVSVAAPHRISFRLRVDSGIIGEGDFSIFANHVSSTGPSKGKTSWMINISPDQTWQFTDGGVKEFLETEIPVVNGKSYYFEVSIDPVAKQYAVYVKDEADNKEYRSPKVLLEPRQESVGRHLGFHTRLAPGTEGAISIADISIEPEN